MFYSQSVSVFSEPDAYLYYFIYKNYFLFIFLLSLSLILLLVEHTQWLLLWRTSLFYNIVI